MLPAGITRDVLGDRRRADAPASQTAQLVGRSRNERLLDGIYNRQSRNIRENERRRRLLKYRMLNGAPKKPANFISSSTANEPEIKRVKKEQRTECPDTTTVISNLIKYSLNPAKFVKVVKLSSQLITSAYSELYQDSFIDLFCALSLNNVSSIVECRKNLIVYGELLIDHLKINLSIEDSTDYVLPEMLSDEEFCHKFLSSKISLKGWCRILSLSLLWTNKLYTDDTYEFYQALSHFSRALSTLPDRSLVCQFYQNPLSSSSLFSTHCQSQQECILKKNNTCHKNIPSVKTDFISEVKIENESSELHTVQVQHHDKDTISNEQIISGGVSHTSSQRKSESISASLDSSKQKEDNHKTHHPARVNKYNVDHKTVSSIPFDICPSTEQCYHNRCSTVLAAPHEDSFEQEYQAWLPARYIAYQIQREFIMNALPTIFQFSKTRWARPAVAKFFQDVYLERSKKFEPSEIALIDSWQTEIRRSAPLMKEMPFGLTNRPLSVGESINPVRDGREEKIINVSGVSVWSAKQLGL